jgi:hypothetical protein
MQKPFSKTFKLGKDVVLETEGLKTPFVVRARTAKGIG